MRCPKCKFISFDDLSSCAKCAHDLSALAAELNGTCTETHLDFFLAPAIQTPNFEEDSFSDSQSLPPIDHGEINFDDTSTGGFAAIQSQGDQEQEIGLDDSVGFMAEDDVSIELGDIMPIDLDQLDETSGLTDDTASTTSGLDDDIDLNLTGKFASNNFDLGMSEDLSDIDLDDTNLGMSDDTSVLSAKGSSDDTILSLDNDVSAIPDSEGEFDLDDELIAELSDTTDDLDATATLPIATGSFDTDKLSETEEISAADGAMEFDESLIAELSIEEDSETDEDLFVLEDDAIEVEGQEALSTDFSEEESDNDLLSFSEPTIEDLTGEFPPIADGEEPELSSLDFSDIDVSDLVSPDEDVAKQEKPESAPPSVDDTLGLDSGGIDDHDELDLDQLDESDLAPIDVGSLDVTLDASAPKEEIQPELLLEDDDNDEGPPDLPLA